MKPPHRKTFLRVGVAGAMALALAAACTTTVVHEADTTDGGDAVQDEDTGTPTRDAGGARGEDAGGDSAKADDAATSKDAGHEATLADAKPPVDCAAPPASPIFTSPLGPFCPFQAGNVFSNCAVGEHCCEYAEEAATPSTCTAGQTACGVAIATGFDWRCDETNDCPGGQVCCFDTPILPRPECPGLFGASPTSHASACRVGTCAAGETRMCASSAECPAGKSCREIRVRGKHFGFCY